MGACPQIVRLLSSQEEWLQVSAARCVAILAEDLRCTAVATRTLSLTLSLSLSLTLTLTLTLSLTLSLSRCQKDLVKARAIDPLILLGTYGNDVAKAYAVAALDLLRLNNAQAYKQIVDKGGMQMLEGLKQYGVGSCRARARAGRQRGTGG